MEEEESFWLFLSLAPAPSLTCRLWRARHYQMFPGDVHPFGLAPSRTLRWYKLPAWFLNICCLRIPLQGDRWSLQIKQFRGKFSVWIADFSGGETLRCGSEDSVWETALFTPVCLSVSWCCQCCLWMNQERANIGICLWDLFFNSGCSFLIGCYSILTIVPVFKVFSYNLTWCRLKFHLISRISSFLKFSVLECRGLLSHAVAAGCTAARQISALVMEK